MDARRLPPHRLRTFKRWRNPPFAAAVEDVVGLYMDPPTRWCCASTRRARSKRWSGPAPTDRSPSAIPAAETDDYAPHGTTTLFAARDVLAGTVLGRCMPRHRNGEFIRFLNAVEATVPPGKAIRAIREKAATH